MAPKREKLLNCNYNFSLPCRLAAGLQFSNAVCCFAEGNFLDDLPAKAGSCNCSICSLPLDAMSFSSAAVDHDDGSCYGTSPSWPIWLSFSSPTSSPYLLVCSHCGQASLSSSLSCGMGLCGRSWLALECKGGLESGPLALLVHVWQRDPLPAIV